MGKTSISQYFQIEKKKQKFLFLIFYPFIYPLLVILQTFFVLKNGV